MMTQGFSNVVALVCLLVASTSAFVLPAARVSSLAPRAATATASTSAALRPSPRRSSRSALFMAEEELEAVEAVEEAVVDPAQDATASVKSFFAPNENVRLGSSRDQDGKSNVWAVEPKMRVEGTDVESPESNKLVVVGGLIGALVVAMGATIALLPAPDSI